jgi:hypothetical protein
MLKKINYARKSRMSNISFATSGRDGRATADGERLDTGPGIASEL